MKDFLIEQIKVHQLTNIYLIPYQPRETMPDLVAYADMHFIFMSADMEGHGFPSKVYTIMACAKPLMICSGSKSPIYRFLENLDCAYLIGDNNIESKVNKIVAILRDLDREKLNIMGNLGQMEVLNNYSSDVVSQLYVNLANLLLSNDN